MSRIRKSTAWGIDASTTSAAPVSPAGSISIRSNALALGLEVSYDGAAYVPFSGGGGSGTTKWNALTAPDGDLTIAHGNWKTQFDFTAADAAENCFTIQSASDATGTGAVLYIRSQGTTSTKLPFKVDANGAAAFAIDAGGSGTFSKDLLVTDGETILSRTSNQLTEHPLLVIGTLTGTNTSANLYYNSRFFFDDAHSSTGLDSTCAVEVLYRRSTTGTWDSAAGIASNMLVLGTGAGTVSYWKGFSASLEVGISSELSQWAGFYAAVSGGDVISQYGFIAELGLSNGFGIIAPTATLHVSGTMKIDLTGDATGDTWYRNASGLVTRLGIGTTGQVLTVAAGLPSWGAGGGGMTVAGSGTELQYRSSGTALAAVAGSSVTSNLITLADRLTVTSDTVAALIQGLTFSTTLAPILGMVRGRGTAASPAAVQAGDRLGLLGFAGQFNTTVGNASTSAGIAADAASNFTALNDAAADLLFLTKTAGSLAPHIAIRITSTRNVGIGEDIIATDVTHKLTVLGNVKFNVGSDATGDVFYRASDGTFTRLGIGSSTQVLTVTGGLPVWAAAAGAMTVAGSGTELQYRSSGTALAAVTSSSASGSDVALGGAVAALTRFRSLYSITTPTASSIHYAGSFEIENAATSSISGAKFYGLRSLVKSTTTTTQPTSLIGLFCDIQHTQVSPVGSLVGLQVEALATGASSAVSMHGLLMDLIIGSNRTVTEMYGIQLALNAGVTGSVTTAYGVFLEAQPGFGTFTTYYGLYLTAAASGITNKYGIVVDSNAGNSGFGLINPSAKLHVSGTVKLDVVPGSDATGDMWYRGAAGNLTRVSIGATGDVLKVLAGGPVWGPPTGGMVVAGSGTELQYRSSGTALAALTSSSVSGADLTLGGQFKTDAVAKGFGLYDISQTNLAQYYSQFGTFVTQHELYFRKASGTQASPGNAAATDSLGTIYFQARNAGSYATIASIAVAQDASGNLFQISVGSNSLRLYSNSFALNIGSDATGDTYYRNSSGRFVRLPIGASTQVLTVTGGVPVWAAASGGMTVAGSGTELQYRLSGTALAALAGSSVTSNIITVADTFKVTSDSTTASFQGLAFSTTNAPLFFLVRGRGTAASPTAVQAGDNIGQISFNGQFNTTVANTTTGAVIRAVAAATYTASNDAATDIEMGTKTSGSLSVPVRLRIQTDGFVIIAKNSVTGDALAQLHVKADGASTKGLIVSSDASATGNLVELQHSGTARVKFVPVAGGAINSVFATAALATSATDGDVYLPTCSGTPTGVPTGYSGTVVYRYDTSANKIWVYNGAWRGVVVT